MIHVFFRGMPIRPETDSLGVVSTYLLALIAPEKPDLSQK